MSSYDTEVEPWTSFTVRLPPDLADAVGLFAESIGEDVLSQAANVLIAAGLEVKSRNGDLHQDKTIIANAKDQAVTRLANLVQAIISDYLVTPLEGEPDEEAEPSKPEPEEGEEGDEEFEG